MACGGPPAAPASVTSDRLFVDGKAEPNFRREPIPSALPPWITAAEFEYYLREHARLITCYVAAPPIMLLVLVTQPMPFGGQVRSDASSMKLQFHESLVVSN